MDDQTPRRGTPAEALAGGTAGGGATADQTYRDHAPLLRHIAVRKFQIPLPDAENIVHDVFIAYLVRRDNIRDNVRGFLIASVCNASRNYWRSRKSYGNVFSDNQVVEHHVPDERDVVTELADHQLVSAVLARLEASCRDALRRYYLDGEKTAAIASTLRTSPNAVNIIMHRCRKRARELYEMLLQGPTCR
jgi:RNA polymerase sigma factor (sigma-70 family)